MNRRRPRPSLTRAVRWTQSSCGDQDAALDPSLLHTVQRGELVIRVRERGELHAARDTRVTSTMEGRNTLIYLIPEGTVVEAGDRLAELDASAIEEKRSTEAIAVAKVDAALEQARKNFEIMEKELEAADNTAVNRQIIAGMQAQRFMGQMRAGSAGAGGTNEEIVSQLRDLIEEVGQVDPQLKTENADLVGRVEDLFGSEENLRLQMGEMANQILQQIDAIRLARADLELAADTVRHSESLEEKGFITKNELDRDLINLQRQLSQTTLAWNNLKLLIHYTLPENQITIRQEVVNSGLGLESVRAAGEAQRVREAAELRSSQAEFELAQQRLEDWTLQVQNAVLFAPSPGLVVYGRWDWDEPVYEGMEVRERQEIIILPDVRTMIAELAVHEAQIDKVVQGQLALVKLDAFPGRIFDARVVEVSTLPTPTRSRDIKLYDVVVELLVDNSDGTLRPGMSATVEIDVGALQDTLSVPLPALERSGDSHFVWKATDQGPQACRVELGGNNLTHVEIVAGLAQGDRIYLVQPKGATLPATGGEVQTASDASADEAVLAAGRTTDS